MVNDNNGVLSLVGTPLGNREDLSPRARRVILEADLLLCEDTRSPSRLLGDGVLLPKRVSCFVGNEAARIPQMLIALKDGQHVVYLSEAGMPIWSDPGQSLVEAAINEGYQVDVIPGPTAATTALCLSGFAAEGARFVGFLPRSGSDRTRVLAQLAHEPGATMFYEAGNRMKAFARDLAEVLPNSGARRVVVGRELTKMHQEVLRSTVEQLPDVIHEPMRGEVTVVLEGAGDAMINPARESACELFRVMMDTSMKPRPRAREVARLTGLRSQDVYDQFMHSEIFGSKKRDPESGSEP